MNIKEMFYKEIDREIKGVIKVGQADDENVYQELEEYVVTADLEAYMGRFIDAYKKGLLKPKKVDGLNIYSRNLSY